MCPCKSMIRSVLLFLESFLKLSVSFIYFQDVLDNLKSGKSSIMSLGLTPKRMLVLITTNSSQLKEQQLIVYDMPRSAFSRASVTLSNGALVKEKWPTFYQVIKDQSLGKLTTVFDDDGEYLLSVKANRAGK